MALDMNRTEPEARTILVVDDDAPLRARLGRALESRGFSPTLAASVQEAVAALRTGAPEYAVVDMKLGDGAGLDVVHALREAGPDTRIVVLTGYGNIASAVAAVKAGVVDFLAKPADADDVARALLSDRAQPPAQPERLMTPNRVRWEHIQRIFELCGGNVSETARRLGMHRRTLQRILGKRAPL